MKIRNITLCNIKNFRGRNTIDLAGGKSNKNNIILIGGANGSGKTTILESVKLCMFGKRFKNSLSNKDYEKYIISTKNKSSLKNNDDRFFIQMEIEIEDTFPIYSITLKRDWKLNAGKLAQENFTILRDGMPFEIIPREYWGDYVISVVPPYISDYFFFDGERVKELAIGNNAEEILRESIRDLMGLKLYEILVADLESLISKIKRRNIGHSEFREKIKEREIEISMINEQISRIENDIEIKSHELTDLETHKKIIESDLRRKAGAFARERKKRENELLKLKEELNELNNEMRQICDGVLPFVIASDVCKDLLDQLKKEKRLKELIASKHILKEINQSLMKKVESSEKFASFPKKQLNFVKTEINNIFLEMFEELNNNEPQEFFHDLANAEMDSIENFLYITEKSGKTRLNDILKRKEKILLQSKKLKNKLKQVPDEGFVKEYIEELTSIRTKIEILGKNINSLENEKHLLKEKKSKTEKVIKELEEKIVCIEEDSRKINICTKIIDSLKEFTNTVISSKIEELEKIITNMYCKLANKDDMVKEIKIDPKTFTTTLIDFEGGTANKENISTGEKEIYALSVLWGLSKISKRKLPLIVDSPLARLDKSHAEKIIKNFFPNAGEEVIILSHDKEIDKGLYEKLKPYINKSYMLSLGEENKINKGYFFD